MIARADSPEVATVRDLGRLLKRAKARRVRMTVRRAIVDAIDVAWREEYARRRRAAARKCKAGTR